MSFTPGAELGKANLEVFSETLLASQSDVDIMGDSFLSKKAQC